MVRCILMGKAPVPGNVKTRLLSRYTPMQAAAIYARMLELTLSRVARLFADVWVAADDPAAPCFAELPHELVHQGNGDLGRRMLRLMRLHFASSAEPVVFLGCDSPHMPDERVLLGLEALAWSDVVIGPVEDGGYDLLGMRRPVESIFRRIGWGGARVMEQTLCALEDERLTVHLLSSFYDLDFPEDLVRCGWAPMCPSMSI